jgi:hypothetical protein
MNTFFPPFFTGKQANTLSPSIPASVRFSGSNPEEPILDPPQVDHFLKLLDAVKARVQGGVPQKELSAVTAEMATLAKQAKDFPQGKYYLDAGTQEHVIDPLDGQDPLRLSGVRKVYGPGTSVQAFLDDAFGEGPRLVICPVGWTVPDPDNVASNNPMVAQRFADLESQVAQRFEPGSTEYQKELTKQKKMQIKKYYEAAFKQWWGPVQKQLQEVVQRNGFNNGQVVFLTSASYDGIDKAAIDFATENGMKVAMATPYTYARWMSTDVDYPLLITNTISDYADACAEADVTLVTGGREHTLGEDIARGLIGKKNTVLTVDLLNEALKISVPAWKDGKIENTAAYMLDQGFRLANNRLALNPVNIPGLRDSQRDAVAVLDAVFNLKNIGR